MRGGGSGGSSYYIPAMRRFYRLAQLLPIDKKLVVFEAGMGKQYADSPRYIYEELLRRGDERTKVWSYTGPLPVADANTRIVKRHSPAFYYYLARAGYWVSNQNFPYYVTRRRDAVYLQTWHGTPLKRMLHDLDRCTDATRATSSASPPWSSSGRRCCRRARSPPRRCAARSGTTATCSKPAIRATTCSVLRNAEQIAARIRRRFDIRADQRVILYAPTFRDDQPSRPGKFTFDLPLDLERLHDEFGEDTVMLLRMHVHVESAHQDPETPRAHSFAMSRATRRSRNSSSPATC